MNVKALKRKWDRRERAKEEGRTTAGERASGGGGGALDLPVDEKRKEDRTREREMLGKGEERDQDHLFHPPSTLSGLNSM